MATTITSPSPARNLTLCRAQALPADIAILTDACVARSGPALGLVQDEMIYVLRGSGLGLVPIEAASTIFGGC